MISAIAGRGLRAMAPLATATSSTLPRTMAAFSSLRTLEGLRLYSQKKTPSPETAKGMATAAKSAAKPADPNSRGFGALEGLKVLDLTAVLMGPFATQMLADHGANVIKIEGPEGDTTRQLPMFKAPGMGSMFLNLNRGKRSLGLDLKKPEAREALLKMAADSDVFIHAMRSDAIARLGLTYADVSAVNPSIIYANVYGFSRRGQYTKKPAYDDVIQAMSGMAGVQQRMQGVPSYSGTLVADKVTGITALYAVLMALLHRAKTGQGQEIEVPMFETMANFVLTDHMNGSLYNPPEGEPIYPRAASPNRRPFKTKDGWVAALIYTDKQWRSFLKHAGNPEWGKKIPATMKERAVQIDKVYGALADALPERTTAEWLELFDRAEIPAARINSTQDVIDDPHLNEIGFFIEQDTELGGFKFPGMPVWLSKTPGRVDGPAPFLGAHSVEIMEENGFSREEIEGLEKAGALLVHKK